MEELHLTLSNHNLLVFLVNSKEEYQDFMDNYWMGEKKQSYAISLYRLKKIEEANVQYGEFAEIFDTDPKSALERLFQHPVYEEDVKLFFKRVIHHDITLENLYEKHREEVGCVFLQIIL